MHLNDQRVLQDAVLFGYTRASNVDSNRSWELRRVSEGHFRSATQLIDIHLRQEARSAG